jgi:hypothetical protein
VTGTSLELCSQSFVELNGVVAVAPTPGETGTELEIRACGTVVFT